MKKIFYIFDKNPKAQKLKKKILNDGKNLSLKKAEIIAVAGGDGFMLKNLKKYYKFNIPFYGINCGNFCFLKNKLNKKKFNT